MEPARRLPSTSPSLADWPVVGGKRGADAAFFPPTLCHFSLTPPKFSPSSL